MKPGPIIEFSQAGLNRRTAGNSARDTNYYHTYCTRGELNGALVRTTGISLEGYLSPLYFPMVSLLAHREVRKKKVRYYPFGVQNHD